MTLTHLDLDRIEGLPEEHRALATNHERIWLSPRCEDERTWCQDDIGCCDECGEPTVEYVRADIAAARIRELEGALEPFAALAEDYLADTVNFDDETIMAGRMTRRGEEGSTPPRVTFADFRRARTALQRKTS